jgi:hypothetical protein
VKRGAPGARPFVDSFTLESEPDIIQAVISKSLCASFLGLALTFGGVPAQAGAAPDTEPSSPALHRLEKLRVRKMGVDRAGNLWAWGSGLGIVTLISPAGADLGLMKASGARAVDVDSEWGAVGLFLDGYEIQGLRDDGEPRATLRLDGPAADVCWMGPDLVAVTPQRADHRIEIWSLKKGALVKALGEEVPLHPVPGATRMRAVLLRYDFERGLLYSLESFTGDLQVFDREGKLAWRAGVENPLRPGFEKWLGEVDAKAKAERDIQTPTIYGLRLALSQQGDLWVLQNRDDDRRTETFLKIGPEGRSIHVLPAGDCPSYNFVVWRSQFVTFREPESPQGACVGWIPVP